MGYGGALIWTGLVRNIALAYPQKKIIILHRPMPRAWLLRKPWVDRVIYLNHPQITGIFNKVEWFWKRSLFNPEEYCVVDTTLPDALYWTGETKEQIFYKKGRHAIQVACDAHRVPCQCLRPQIFLLPSENEKVERLMRKEGLESGRYFCVEPNVFSMVGANKRWAPESWRKVVEEVGRHPLFLHEGMKWVQLGAPTSDLLQGCRHLCGQLSFRESAYLLQESAGLVTYVGALMHLARAVGTRSFVVASAWEPRELATYPEDMVFYTEIECKHCGWKAPCPYGTKCMKDIDPDEVIGALLKYLDGMGSKSDR